MADNSFTSLFFFAALRQRRPIVITSRRLITALYDRTSPRASVTVGRSREAGWRPATLARVAADPATAWQCIQVQNRQISAARDLQHASAIAMWRHDGLLVGRVRWVGPPNPMQRGAPALALVCADLDRIPQEIVSSLVRRWCTWSIETTFEEVRTPRGVGTRRQSSDRAIAGTELGLSALFSIIT